jgi:hypothetical protein
MGLKLMTSRGAMAKKKSDIFPWFSYIYPFDSTVTWSFFAGLPIPNASPKRH